MNWTILLSIWLIIAFRVLEYRSEYLGLKREQKDGVESATRNCNKAAGRLGWVIAKNESEDFVGGTFYPERKSTLSVSFANKAYSLSNGYEKIEFEIDGYFHLTRNYGPYSAKRVSLKLFYEFEIDDLPPIERELLIYPLGTGEFEENKDCAQLSLRLGKNDIFDIRRIINDDIDTCCISFGGPVKNAQEGRVEFYVDSFEIRTDSERPSLEQLNERRPT